MLVYPATGHICFEHRRRSFLDAIQGSTTERVLRQAARPVRVVPAHAEACLAGNIPRCTVLTRGAGTKESHEFESGW
jgi:hypothetical protein